ncbi:hypothetical protein [Methanosarcina spelaei]|uniref:hypothetical protein n=1 Tax=Methanosarcina spelaei TaxID=1036679 RepID=UPI001482BDA4|nr:hypothetical protein [Methanosarcina spelaei]
MHTTRKSLKSSGTLPDKKYRYKTQGDKTQGGRALDFYGCFLKLSLKSSLKV